jgi:hypothetical protein
MLRLRWKNNIKMFLKEVGWKIVGWILVTQDRDKCCAVVKVMQRKGGGGGRISGVVEQFVASQGGLCPMWLFISLASQLLRKG